MRHSIEDALGYAKQTLEYHSESWRLDAELLLCQVLECSRTYLYAHSEQKIPDSAFTSFMALLNRRKLGEPVSYLTNHKEFYSMAFKVTPNTLIPRPETELLVTLGLNSMDKTHMRILDLGTGCGNIAIAISANRKKELTTITATDICNNALNISRENALAHNIDNINFKQSNWFHMLENQRYNLIVSNPPYVDENDYALLEKGLRYEPKTALISAKNGLENIRQIIENAGNHLYQKGWMMLEHGADQSEAVYDLFVNHGFKHVTAQKDINHFNRVCMGQWQAS